MLPAMSHREGAGHWSVVDEVTGRGEKPRLTQCHCQLQSPVVDQPWLIAVARETGRETG